MSKRFISWNLEEVIVNEPIPGPIYLYIDFRFITYRGEGDCLDRMTYDRLYKRKVRSVFIQEGDREKFDLWVGQLARSSQPETGSRNALAVLRKDANRKLMDIFESNHPNEVVAETMGVSKKLVDEVMGYPFSTKPLSLLQSYSPGTVHHSVNVSMLAVYLAMHMGYSHFLILQHIATGSILHDFGKTRIDYEENEPEAQVEAKLKQHPTLGAQFFAADHNFPNEVRMIIEQHHEYNDGTGYPKGMTGSTIYDLAKIVSIANEFDGLVSNGKGTIAERQKQAIATFEGPLKAKFDPKKHEKVLKILKLGL